MSYVATETIASALTTTATVFQIAFWLGTVTLAFLGYLGARKTLFQPLRTEIFKRQIDDLSEILQFFVGKGEVKLRDEFDFGLLEQANIEAMYDAYVYHAFKVKRRKEARAYRSELCPAGMIKAEILTEQYILVDGHKEEPVEPPPEPASWTYKGGQVYLPKRYVKQEKRIRRLLESPFLPTPVASAIENYLEAVEKNAWLVDEVILQAANEMPEKYPSMEELKEAQFHWIYNRINSRYDKLELHAKEIVRVIRDYFDSDNLLPSKGSFGFSSILRRVRRRLPAGDA
ncbi:hypothetical protein ACH4JS_17750 [Streptomyces sp. NPDC017638]|uniref:hypothetical protein n=1 Tax=Streptomyces sp. NPDC017638 TaxID=3365004 RepID=UPI0037BBF809